MFESSSVRLPLEEKTNLKKIKETERASKNIFSCQRTNDDPVKTITRTQENWRAGSFIS